MIEEPDYYAVLEVSPDADEATIRIAFRRLARKYHPDVAGTGSLERMQQLNVAYQVLSDAERRREYDLTRKVSTRTAPESSPAARPKPRSAGSGATSRRPSRHRAGMVNSTPGPMRRVAVLAAPEEVPVAAVAFTYSAQQAGVGLLDGSTRMWDVAGARQVAALSFRGQKGAGALQELRLSPSGAYAMGWGFQLGARVWQVSDGSVLWSTGMSGPSGAMDAVLFDTPPTVRLALPDAPIALADEDPFRWAFVGRLGTAVMTRPLTGRIDASYAQPLRCVEANASSGARWKTQVRMLAQDGRSLLTFSAGEARKVSDARIIRIWDLEHTTLLGATQPRKAQSIARPREEAQLPVVATPDLAWIGFSVPDAGLRLLRPGTNESRAVRVGDVGGTDVRLALSPDAGYLAVARNSRLDLWQTRDSTLAQRWQFATEITAVRFAPAGPRVLGVGLRNGLVEVWG